MSLFYDEHLDTPPPSKDVHGTPVAADRGAEAAVVGACLIDGTLLDEIRLTAADFDDWRHALIWEALHGLHNAGLPTDATSVVSALMDAGTLAKAGGGPFVVDLMQNAPATQSATWHALRVAEMSRRRAIAAFAAGVAQVAATSLDADEMHAEIQRRFETLDNTSTDEGPRHWSAIITEGMEAIEQAAAGEAERGLPTGLHDLDRAIGGLKPGDVTIIGGRPGSGKSTLAMQIASHVALDLALPVLTFSLEMRRPELYNRVIASRLSIPLDKLGKGALRDDEWSKLARQAGDSADSPLWIEDDPNQTLASIRATARQWQRRHGLRLLVVDYLQLITPPKAENRQVAVSEISRGMKLLAGELNIPIVVAAQLNRNSESRPGRVPTAADLRESGSLENDASVIVLVHREEVADPDTVRKGEADLHLVKNRNGAQDVITVAGQLHYARFTSMANTDGFGVAR